MAGTIAADVSFRVTQTGEFLRNPPKSCFQGMTPPFRTLHGVCSALRREFVEHPACMRPHGILAHVEASGNFVIAQSRRAGSIKVWNRDLRAAREQRGSDWGVTKWL